MRQTKPTISERAREGICPNCGGPVVRLNPRGPVPTFCAVRGKGVCKRQHYNRHVVEGSAVIALLKAWRVDRGTGEIAKTAFAQLCQKIGRESCRERVCQYVYISVVAVSLNKKDIQ